MLFFSKEFLFIFLPSVLILYLLIIKFLNNYKIYKLLLILVSMIFYGLWSFKFLLFFIFLIVFNYFSVIFFQKFEKEKRFFFHYH